MRNLFFVLLIILASCQKEPAEPTKTNEQKAVVWNGTERKPTVTDETGERIGAFYPLFYKESLTTDNYLLYPAVRKQEAYNKAKVDSIYMVRAGTQTVNISGVTHGYYEVRVKFKGEPTGAPSTYISVLNGNNLAYIPYGANVLHSTNQYKVVTLIRAGGKTLYTDWHLGRNKNKLDFNIYGDTTLLGREYLFGSTPTGTMFTLPHK